MKNNYRFEFYLSHVNDGGTDSYFALKNHNNDIKNNLIDVWGAIL